MNTLSEPLLPEVDFLTMAHIEEARAQAQASDRRIVEVLEESLGVPPAEFTTALAQALRFPALSNDRMHSLPPAFDVLPFSEAALHEWVGIGYYHWQDWLDRRRARPAPVER